MLCNLEDIGLSHLEGWLGPWGEDIKMGEKIPFKGKGETREGDIFVFKLPVNLDDYKERGIHRPRVCRPRAKSFFFDTDKKVH